MRVFVFGGTQFMGRVTVEALLDAGHEVVLFNRGRTANPFEGRSNVSHVKCDRMGDRDGFRTALRKRGSCDVLIDFIGFQEAYVQDTIEALTLDAGPDERGVKGGSSRRRFSMGHYIFVSTDSVYWAQRVPVSDSRVGEDDAQDFSQPDFERHLEHCQKTALGEYQLRYGGNKLGCERLLEEAWQADGFPYTVLRLPDVYGPFDNLGGFWELVAAVEAERPIPARLAEGRIRTLEDQPPPAAPGDRRRFSWAFAEDVRDAVVACAGKGEAVHGVTMNVAHEEAVSLRETCEMIAEAMGLSPAALRFDGSRDASLPSTDYGTLDVARALRVLRPWRPTTMRRAVARSVKWFLSCREHRRYHRLVHREPRTYDESVARRFACSTREVPSCWVGAPGPERAELICARPAVLNDALQRFTGTAVLDFMQRLMDQVGQDDVACELQRGTEVEPQTWPLRHLAGHLLTQSDHATAYRLEDAQVLAQTDMLPDLQSPLADIRADDAGHPPRRVLRLGGTGARPLLRRHAPTDNSSGFWDCTLLGRRKWRLFPPETPAAELCVPSRANESPVDCFACGPDAYMVHMKHTGFAPAVCWECEQTMGDTVVVPAGWWYQTYDDDRTLSISASYGAQLPGIQKGGAQDAKFAPPARGPPFGSTTAATEEPEPEVIEFEIVD